MEHVLSFQPDGSIQSLWTEALPLAEFGRLTVERASTVEFNGDSQQWEVRLRGGGQGHTPDFTHPSRQECIAWEIRTIQARL